MQLNKKTVLTIITLLIIVIGVGWIRNNKQAAPSNPADNTNQQKNTSNEPPKIVSTKPDPLEESIVAANEIIEITFNRPLENVGEFKSRIEPEIKYKIELSGDRRSAKIIPEKPYELGTTFTLFIGPETKFDGVGRWGQERVFHFKTIPYRGI